MISENTGNISQERKLKQTNWVMKTRLQVKNMKMIIPVILPVKMRALVNYLMIMRQKELMKNLKMKNLKMKNLKMKNLKMKNLKMKIKMVFLLKHWKSCLRIFHLSHGT